MSHRSPLAVLFAIVTIIATVVSFGANAHAQGYGCQGGSVFNPQTGQCACPPNAPNWDNAAQRCVGCPAGAAWNGSSCGCVDPTPLWDAQSGQCIARCSAAETWNAQAGQCVSRCANGEIWNGSGCSCPPSRPMPSVNGCIACPEFSTWDGSQCVCNPDHPEFHAIRWQCWACRPGMAWDGRRCVAQAPAVAVPVAQPPTAQVVVRPQAQQPGTYYAPVAQPAQPPQPTCRPGAAWDGRSCVCQPPTPVFHRFRNTCEPCPPGRVWDGRRCRR